MRGIILAGGNGTRLQPITQALSKHLIPIYDKPMIYYPLSVLLLAQIREILIISTPRDIEHFKLLLQDGSQLGCEFQYAVQAEPKGIAEAFTIGESFIADKSVALILGDNLFYGSGFGKMIRSFKNPTGAVIFAAPVNDPERYAVVEFDDQDRIRSIEEKPATPQSHYAVPGLYFYDNSVIQVAKNVKPSARGEYEITDVNQHYLKQGQIQVEVFNRGITWLDAGTFPSLTEASSFVRVIEERQGLKVGCIEEVAYYSKFIDKKQLHQLAQQYPSSQYGDYLRNLERAS